MKLARPPGAMRFQRSSRWASQKALTSLSVGDGGFGSLGGKGIDGSVVAEYKGCEGGKMTKTRPDNRYCSRGTESHLAEEEGVG